MLKCMFGVSDCAPKSNWSVRRKHCGASHFFYFLLTFHCPKFTQTAGAYKHVVSLCGSKSSFHAWGQAIYCTFMSGCSLNIFMNMDAFWLQLLFPTSERYQLLHGHSLVSFEFRAEKVCNCARNFEIWSWDVFCWIENLFSLFSKLVRIPRQHSNKWEFGKLFKLTPPPRTWKDQTCATTEEWSSCFGNILPR